MTDVPPYAFINACPWSGVPCDCKQFPWLGVGGVLPLVCGEAIREKMPAMIPFRKLLPSSSGPGRQPPPAGNGGSNPSGSATKQKGHAP